MQPIQRRQLFLTMTTRYVSIDDEEISKVCLSSCSFEDERTVHTTVKNESHLYVFLICKLRSQNIQAQLRDCNLISLSDRISKEGHLLLEKSCIVNVPYAWRCC